MREMERWGLSGESCCLLNGFADREEVDALRDARAENS
jgi:hypothetical protein